MKGKNYMYLSQRRRARREIQDMLSAESRENIILPTLHALAG